MRLRRLLCSPVFLEFTCFAGPHDIHARIVDSEIPYGARLRIVSMLDANTIACDFEHESFDEVAEGTPPLMAPIRYAHIEPGSYASC